MPVIEVIRADITDEEREKRLHRIAVIAGLLVKDMESKGVKVIMNFKGVEQHAGETININDSSR